MTVVEGDQKAPFSIATTQRCRGGPYFFPWIAPLYPWYVLYIAECQTRRCQVPFLESWPGIEPRSPGPLANTLPTRPMRWHILPVMEGLGKYINWQNWYFIIRWKFSPTFYHGHIIIINIWTFNKFVFCNLLHNRFLSTEPSIISV